MDKQIGCTWIPLAGINYATRYPKKPPIVPEGGTLTKTACLKERQEIIFPCILLVRVGVVLWQCFCLYVFKS